MLVTLRCDFGTLLILSQIAGPFTTDIIQASTRVNYGQNLGLIHGLETMVCMAIEGAMQIEGGNWQIFDGMLKASNAAVLLNTSVDSITKNPRGAFNIKASSQDAGSDVKYTRESSFDTVVLAAPLQFSIIDIENGLLKHTPDTIPYVTLHVTLFTSPYTLSPTFFNLLPDAEVPSTILTTIPPDEVPENPEDGVGSPGFFSISTLRKVINPKTNQKEYLYKIFSPKEVTSKFVSDILRGSSPSP
jgi:prenylcysteine oxidase/farnesylcysteine lyase